MATEVMCSACSLPKDAPTALVVVPSFDFGSTTATGNCLHGHRTAFIFCISSTKSNNFALNILSSNSVSPKLAPPFIKHLTPSPLDTGFKYYIAIAYIAPYFGRPIALVDAHERVTPSQFVLKKKTRSSRVTPSALEVGQYSLVSQQQRQKTHSKRTFSRQGGVAPSDGGLIRVPQSQTGEERSDQKEKFGGRSVDNRSDAKPSPLLSGAPEGARTRLPIETDKVQSYHFVSEKKLGDLVRMGSVGTLNRENPFKFAEAS